MVFHFLHLLLCFQEERAHVVRQDNCSGRGHAGRNGRHACSKDACNEQASKAYGQTIDDEVGEYVVGLGLNLCRQLSDASLIVAVKGATNEEEQGAYRNEQIASEECRKLRILVRLGRMIALHVVLVDAVVLQVNKNAVNQTYPEGRRREVCRKRTQRELVAHRRVYSELKGLHRAFRH